MIPQPPAPQTPIAVISGGVERAVPDLALPQTPELSGPELVPDAPVFVLPGQAAGLAPQGPVPPVAVAPAVLPQQLPTAIAPAPVLRPVPAGPAAVSVPKPAAPVPGRGLIGSVPERGLIGSVPEPGAIGNPRLFGDADLGGAAARALPGLAAILAMTAIGAVLGYRQAKAGHMLRAAGAARFLQ